MPVQSVSMCACAETAASGVLAAMLEVKISPLLDIKSDVSLVGWPEEPGPAAMLTAGMQQRSMADLWPTFGRPLAYLWSTFGRPLANLRSVCLKDASDPLSLCLQVQMVFVSQ